MMTMRASTLFLAAALSLPALGALAQTAPLSAGGNSASRETDAISEVLRSRGTPTGRVGGATRGLRHDETKPPVKAGTQPLASATPTGR
jgi:hypothetical protein